MLTHILQSALCFSVDLAFAFPAVLLVKRQSAASGARNIVQLHGALETANTLPTCHLQSWNILKGSRGN